MSTTIETPSTAPVAEASLDDIISQELSAAAASGTDVVKDEPAPGEVAPAADPAAAPAPATGDAPAEPTTEAEPAKPDDVTAARVRKMLAKIDEREAALTAREAQLGGDVLGELLRNPKALLAKYGKSIDDVIDASLAEGKAPAPAAEDDNPRLTALERRLEQKEHAEFAAQQQAAINGRKTQIQNEIKSSAKFPLLNEAGKAADVTDFMIEYHSIHGKPISWEKAAGMIESDLRATGEKIAKKLGWAAPAAPAAAAPKDRPGTVSLSGDQRTSVPAQGDEPEDPERLLAYLVAQAGL